MSHQTAGGNGPGTPAPEEPPAAEPKEGLSVVKVTGQALAAVTTAGVGAFFGGAEGTIAGAALASVVTTVGDALYQRSLERTRDSVRAAIRSRRGSSGRPASDDGAGPARPVAGKAATPYGAGDGFPGRHGAGDGGPTRQTAGDAAPGRPLAGSGVPMRQMAGDGVPGRHGGAPGRHGGADGVPGRHGAGDGAPGRPVADPAGGARQAPPPWPPPAPAQPQPAGSPGRHAAPPDAEPTSTLSGPPVTVRQAPRGPGGAAAAPLARNGHGAPPPPDESPTRSIPPLDPDATRVQGGGPADATRVQGAPPPTRVAPAMGDDARTQLVGSGPGGPDDPDDPGDDDGPPRRGWGARRYALLAATAALIFLVAMLGVTGIEKLKGSPLSGGAPGSTSVGSVFKGGAPTTTTARSDDATPTSVAPTSASPESDAPTTTTRSRSGGANGDSGGSQDTTTERSRPGLVPSGLLGN